MTEIEQCRNAIKEYRKGYGQSQLPTDCIIQLMIGHHQSRVNAISDLFYDLKAYFEANNEGNATNEFLNRIKEQLLKQ